MTTNGTNSPTTLPRTLYVRLSERNLCFARYELRHEPVFIFAPWDVQPETSLGVNLREAKETVELLRESAARVEVIVDCPVTPVPMADFQEEDCERLYDHCFTADAPRRIFYDTFPYANAVLLFALNNAACQALEETFGEGVHYTAALTHVLKHFAAKDSIRSDGGKRFFAYLHDYQEDIAVFDGKRLLMLNRYEVQTATDVAYYTLNAAQELGMATDTDAFYLAGEQEMREQAVAELGHYAKNLHNLNPTGEFNRHTVSTTPGVPYDLMTALVE
ncbi:MAG: DUF3822 family protein [Alloprevotella sp.]|nr:DUF3822 family protein [Alloprevotella sp.]